jgi:hypothetical protein
LEGANVRSGIRPNVGAFSDRVQEHLRTSGYSQKELADDLSLHPKVLSRKLHGSGNSHLTHLEIQHIITTLAHWHAITTREEALDLLELAQVGPTIFSDEEWRTPPLSTLARKRAQSTQRLCVFLCHSSGDKPQVRDIYKRLTAEGIKAWLDEESLLPGQDWELEISRAICSTHVVIVCLSQNSTTKRGYVQKEIKFALNEADKQPEGTIFIIPVKVEECDLPDRLRRYHTVKLFEERGFEKLVGALRSRADELELTLTSI